MTQRLIQFGSGPTRGVFGIMLFSKKLGGGNVDPRSPEFLTQVDPSRRWR